MNFKLASSTWDESEIAAMHEVINSGNFTMGKKVKDFEQAFAQFFGSKFAVMSNSGSSANLLAVAAMRYRGDFDDSKTDIIVPAVSWSTTYYPVHQLGFRLKFVDVDINTLNSTASSIEAAIDEKTAGIFAVNLLGNPSELNAIRKIADARGIFFLEDNCESMGATLEGKFAGTFGDIGTFSTFFSHHISTMEGGMCLTDNQELAEIMTSLRAHGWTRELPEKNSVHNKTGSKFDDQFRFVLPGYNLRPLELEGAIGIRQLVKLPGMLQIRRENQKALVAEIKNDFDDLLFQQEYGSSSWFGFSMILRGQRRNHRAELSKIFNRFGIEHRPIVAGDFTKNPVMKHLRHCELTEMPNAADLHSNGLFVGNHHYPFGPELKSLRMALEEFWEST